MANQSVRVKAIGKPALAIVAGNEHESQVDPRPTARDIDTMEKLVGTLRAIHRLANSPGDEIEDIATIGALAKTGYGVAEDWFRKREANNP